MRFFLKASFLFINHIINLLNYLINKIIFIYQEISVGSFRINGVLKIYNDGHISIGDNFKANSGKNYNPIGGDTTLRLICHKNAKLIIVDNVGISNSTIKCSNGITIENNVLIGGGCKIWDTDFHSLNYKIRGTKNDWDLSNNHKIIIKKHAFIGGGSKILKGVIVGEKSIVAAGSVVSKSIPGGQIWGGNPAKFIKNI